MMQIQQDAAAPAVKDVASAKRPGAMVRFLNWYWGKRDEGEKGNPITRTFIALVLVALGVLGSEAYQWGKAKVVGPDDFLVTIREEQAASFRRLEEGLSSLRSGDRDSVSEVRGAVDEIRRINASLLARLQLANAENERVARSVGVPGGVDMILTRDTGMPLDAQSEVGVQNIQSNGAYVSVSSLAGDSAPQFLRSGESIAYNSADGRACRVILRSVDSRSAVSLSNRCSS